MSDYSAVNPPTEKNQSQAFAAALQRAKEVCKQGAGRMVCDNAYQRRLWLTVVRAETGRVTREPRNSFNP